MTRTSDAARRAYELSMIKKIERHPAVTAVLDRFPGSRVVRVEQKDDHITMATHIDILFDGPPSHGGARFVEVENDRQESINLGEWIQREDGLWALRLKPDDMQRAFNK